MEAEQVKITVINSQLFTIGFDKHAAYKVSDELDSDAYLRAVVLGWAEEFSMLSLSRISVCNLTEPHDGNFGKPRDFRREYIISRPVGIEKAMHAACFRRVRSTARRVHKCPGIIAKGVMPSR